MSIANKLTKVFALAVVAVVAFGMTFSFASALTTAELDAYIAQGFSAEWIMANVGGSSSASSSTSMSCAVYGLPGVMGIQKAVNQTNYSPKLVEDGVFGSKTKAGVIYAQGVFGTKVDGAWGVNTQAAYENWVSVNCADDADESDDSNNNSNLSGGAGSVDSYDLVTKYNNEEVGEGQDDQIVAGLEIEASDDSDLEITAMKLVFAQGTATNDRFDDFASEVAVWFDGDKVAEVDADEFDEDNNYSKTISLDSGVIVRAGETEKVLVSVSGANNIDSGDLGDTWNVDFRQVRFADGQGVVITEDPSTNTRTFSFESFSSSADTEFKITTDDDDDKVNEAHVIDVDDTEDTEDVAILSFTVEIEGDADVELDDLPVYFETNATNVDNVISQVSLWVDGDEIQSENVSGTLGTSETITFDDMNLNLEAGEKYQFEVKADFIRTDSTSADGDTILAKVSSTERDAADINDEEGDDLITGDRTGTAIGEAHVIYDNGIDVELVSVSKTRSFTGDATGEDDQGTYEITFDVENFGDVDLYIDRSTEDDNGSDAAGQGVVFDITSTAGTPTVSSSLLESSTTDSSDNANVFQIEQGDTRRFTLQVVLTADTTPTPGSHEVMIESINWGTATDNTNANYYTFDLEDFKTGSLYLNAQ